MDEDILDNQEDVNNESGNNEPKAEDDNARVVGLSGLYQDWFLDYASYVILERAVPDLRDGLKPVHRRIMHSMKELDDGRYNKVANIIGNTMKYHPHGDASIGNALVQLGQKELLIDMQGNWGNILTGDSAAAPRYIEARLSKFALDVVFNPKTTSWLLSYDGRNREPEALPVKFPLLLAQGVEGIAVGLASKILPHNFIELIDASISYLRGRSFQLYPDFITGGMADVSKYNDGIRGGKVRIRARISKEDKKTLIINEIPFTTTTSGLIDSIISANDKGKIKIKKIEDNTAESVEIKITLGSGVSPDQTIDALYAFTSCELSISPNSCVIDNNKPKFLGVKEQLKISADHTVSLLKMELDIRRDELMEQWHFSNLEKIFIQERIYHQIEEAESWEEALGNIDNGLIPFKKLFKREITRDDIIRLTEIKIKRISKYNEFKANEHILNLEEQIKEVDYHLAHLVDYAVDYFKSIKKKYGAGRERRTELRSFENIDAAAVAVSNVKLYVNREEGFIGTGLKKDELLFECSDIDDIIVFRDNGTFVVNKLADKVFVGKGIIHVGVFNKSDDRTTYNMIYRDGKAGASFAKRFSITSITRDKIYHLTKGKPDSKVLYFTANPNGEAEIVKIKLRHRAKIRKLIFDLDFSTLGIKGRTAKGNTVTKFLISSIVLKEDGISTLGARDIWYDDTVKRLNADERGIYLGAFGADDMIVTILSTGEYLLTGFDLSTHFDEDMIKLCKYDSDVIWSMVYFDGKSGYYYLKRFQLEKTNKKTILINNHPKSRMLHITKASNATVEIGFNLRKNPKLNEKEILLVDEFVDVKGYKARGKRLTTYEVKKIDLVEPEEYNSLPIPPNEKAIADKKAKPSEDHTKAKPIDALESSQEGLRVDKKELMENQISEEDKKKKEEDKKKKDLKVVSQQDEKDKKGEDAQNSPKEIESNKKQKATVKESKKEKKAKSNVALKTDKDASKKDGLNDESVVDEMKPESKEKPKKEESMEAKTKPPQRRKRKKAATNTKNKKVSLDSDEPLQMELDF